MVDAFKLIKNIMLKIKVTTICLKFIQGAHIPLHNDAKLF